ncbi:MAG: hypothetical protein AAF529_25060, partial [Pseudomonadota bacterium]
LAQFPDRMILPGRVNVTVSTDDPPFFHTTMTREYDKLADTFGWDSFQFRPTDFIAFHAWNEFNLDRDNTTLLVDSKPTKIFTWTFDANQETVKVAIYGFFRPGQKVQLTIPYTSNANHHTGTIR